MARLEISIGLVRPSAHPTAPALVATGAQTRPTDQVLRIAKHAQVQPDLGDQRPDGHPINPGNRLQPPHRLVEWDYAPVDLSLDGLHLPHQPFHCFSLAAKSQRWWSVKVPSSASSNSRFLPRKRPLA
jgi:hypothetical protein